ncbi:hypothetical protein NCC49_005306 [Naganishia albida]|nr:hypothetical protein NCC49_005306 [Naganishia albida]
MSQNERPTGMFTDPPKDQGEGSGGVWSKVMREYNALAYPGSPESGVPIVSPALRSPIVTTAIAAGVLASMGGNPEFGQKLVQLGATKALLGEVPKMCADLYEAARTGLGREGEASDLESGVSDGAYTARRTKSEYARLVDTMHY